MKLSVVLSIVCCTGVLVACGGRKDAPAAAADGKPAAAAAGKSVGVVLDTARAESFPYEVEALGTANANEAVTLTAKVSNLITAIRFNEGEQVKRGQVLVELDGAEVKAEQTASQAALRESRSQYKRARELRMTNVLSQSELERLEATVLANEARLTTAQAKVRDTVITAPFDGRVGLRRVSVGSFVSQGSVITTLDDTRTIKLDFSVPENFMSVLREGLRVTAHSVAYPDQSFDGEVSSIDSRVDPTTRSVVARALIPNPQGLLKPGMFLTVRLQQPRENVVMIPEQALVPEEGNQFVYVVNGAKAQKRRVDIGRRKPGQVEILAGLKAGERIVVEGTQLMKDGAAVREMSATAQPNSSSRAANLPSALRGGADAHL